MAKSNVLRSVFIIIVIEVVLFLLIQRAECQEPVPLMIEWQMSSTDNLEHFELKDVRTWEYIDSTLSKDSRLYEFIVDQDSIYQFALKACGENGHDSQWVLSNKIIEDAVVIIPAEPDTIPPVDPKFFTVTRKKYGFKMTLEVGVYDTFRAEIIDPGSVKEFRIVSSYIVDSIREAKTRQFLGKSYDDDEGLNSVDIYNFGSTFRGDLDPVDDAELNIDILIKHGKDYISCGKTKSGNLFTFELE